MKNTIKKTLRVLLIIGLLCGAVGFGSLSYVVWEVYYGDYSQLSKKTILAKLEEETSLFYDDEERRIGSIFESRHRRYVRIDEIPASMLNAIVAAEDKNFYRHYGIDPAAISKAFIEGVLAGGRFRRGGSTITQQTVKNIINDWETSFARKFREMIRALQIERIYTKRQILEFYLNQFHVVGNGNGVEIAARYYFDKDVRDLNLIESAFIAGSVKGPSRYNPFIKNDDKEKERALFDARRRKNYVLQRMFDQGWITQEEFQDGSLTDIPFKRGEFRTAEVALVNLLQQQVQRKEILKALGLRGLNDLRTAGLKVFTTIDYDMQKSAQLAMRKNLSRVETLLNGFSVEDPSKFRLLRDLKKNTFAYGKVASIGGTSINDAYLNIDFGIPKGVVANRAIKRYAKLLNLIDGKGFKYHIENILQAIKPGDTLFVRVLNYNKKINTAALELHKTPEVSGGLIALDKGNVKTVISGFNTMGYNRAIVARRQPGSISKTLSYFAALQLGWSILDNLDNTRQIFPYQGNIYFPRPDHISHYKSVSMLWSGVLSENLSAVNLTYRLLDKLNFNQFKEVLRKFDLLPKKRERASNFHYRISKKIGVSLDNVGIKKHQIKNYVDQISPDLVFSNNQKILDTISHTWWGNGYVAHIEDLEEQLTTDVSTKEKTLRLKILLNNYLRLVELNDHLKKDFDKLINLLKTNTPERAFTDEGGKETISHFKVVSRHPSLQIAYSKSLPSEESIMGLSLMTNRQDIGSDLTLNDFINISIDFSFFDKNPEFKKEKTDRIIVDGILSSKQIDNLHNYIQNQFEEIKTVDDRYRLYSYFQHHDFRVGLGLHYLKELTKACGVTGRVEPILSFPLGTTEMTTAEAAKIYQSFVGGKTYKFFDSGSDNQINFIRRVEDRFGKILYETKSKEHQLVTPHISQQTREILKKTITHGTGRRARGELYVEKRNLFSKTKKGGKYRIRIPAFGKTGTTNNFTTSYFAGFMPYPTDTTEGLDSQNSLVVATYVGYDLNKTMKNGRQKIYGGKGALPIWSDFLKDFIKIRKFEKYLDDSDLDLLVKKEWTLNSEKGTEPYLVDLPRGLIIRTAKGNDLEFWKLTNFSVTGEEYQNLFAVDKKTTSILFLKPDSKSSKLQPARSFSLFNKNNLKKPTWGHSFFKNETNDEFEEYEF